jgi:hypothetical protein
MGLHFDTGGDYCICVTSAAAWLEMAPVCPDCRGLMEAVWCGVPLIPV